MARNGMTGQGFGIGTAWRRPAARLAVVSLALLLGACAETQVASHLAKRLSQDGSTQPVPPGTKIGRPYQVSGVWYYPRVQPDYDETGIASWYGDPFHGRKTANGEIYDMNALTAAHKTLPLPTDVRVTNLENGRSIVLRVNDRGPFVAGRIIDVSRRGAQLLGFQNQGVARVRVTALPVGQAPAPAPAPVMVASRPVPEPPAPKPLPPAAAAPVEVVAVAPTRIFVQAGSFSELANARALQAVLSDVGPLQIQPAVVSGRDFYRVRIGPLDSVDLADSALERVLARGHTDARIVVD